MVAYDDQGKVTLRLKKGADDRWRWQWMADNNRVIDSSSQGFTRKWSAKRNARLVFGKDRVVFVRNR
jgi:uncharacterized protein YegP (UPF0339 family)